MKTDTALPCTSSFRAVSLEDSPGASARHVPICAEPGTGRIQLGAYLIAADQIEDLAMNLLFARSVALQSFLSPPAEFSNADLGQIHAKISELGDDWISLAHDVRDLAEELEARLARTDAQYRKLRAMIRRIQDEQHNQRLIPPVKVRDEGRLAGVTLEDEPLAMPRAACRDVLP